ncbi:MAG: type IV pilin [Candidatus Aenigmarchaeota archaeon]|nr:type IV pilin [Candidatus Aenigmarchaeota archaeon]
MKKGITPVIAVILLLLITIAMVGFAFVWFGRVMQSAGNSTEQSMNALTSQQAKRISIDNVNNATWQVTVRNIGSQVIQTSDLAVYVDNTGKTCAWVGMPLAPGGTATCTWSPTTWCVQGQGAVKITAPGNTDEQTC